jgi:hypothetical protein
MPSPALPMLAVAVLSVSAPAAPRTEQVSRIENQTPHGWKLTIGRWVAGQISIRRAGSAVELARLAAEGQAFILDSGKAVDIVLVPKGDSLALQLTLTRLSPGTASPSSIIYLSVGMAGGVPTVIPVTEPAVRVNKEFFGAPQVGSFVLIKD